MLKYPIFLYLRIPVFLSPKQLRFSHDTGYFTIPKIPVFFTRKYPIFLNKITRYFPKIPDILSSPKQLFFNPKIPDIFQNTRYLIPKISVLFFFPKHPVSQNTRFPKYPFSKYPFFFQLKQLFFFGYCWTKRKPTKIPGKKPDILGKTGILGMFYLFPVVMEHGSEVRPSATLTPLTPL